MKHFLANAWRRAHRQKRGGHFQLLSLDAHAGEELYSRAPANLDPEQLFDRRWAITLLRRAMARLKENQLRVSTLARFEKLKVFLTGDQAPPALADVAEQVGMSEPTLKMAVSRLRRRYRDLVRTEVAATVASGADVDEEMRYLLSILE